jgi:phage shock protein PspC (stress-responsive transcriptional regulator)
MSSSETEPDREPDRRSRLLRTRRGRLIGGVCSGLAAHFDVDPILFRIAFVGLAIFSGIGIALYLAILLLVPEEGVSWAPICLLWRGPVANEQWQASADRRLLRWLVLAAVVVVCAVIFALAGAWLAGTHTQLAAWAVVAVGAALVLVAFTRTARRFVLPGVAFALAVATIAAAHVDLHGGVGDRFYRPQSLSEVRSGYQLGAGRLEIDLRDVTFPAGTTQLHVRLGMGQLVVLVPRGVCVATSARVGGGYVGALERRSAGLDVNWSERPSPPPGTSRLLVDGNVGLGALLVADHPVEHGVGSWGRWGGWGGEDGWFTAHQHPVALGTNEACFPARAAGSSSTPSAGSSSTHAVGGASAPAASGLSARAAGSSSTPSAGSSSTHAVGGASAPAASGLSARAAGSSSTHSAGRLPSDEASGSPAKGASR